ncbi:copper resistance D family protein [Alkalihalobacillus pseudalcaliphilus]|uniref:copper resistance D family protein n=1 Tax=Alkalihalobacillus pseudalcaliphilus TaxID=79884 RepID=UPI00064D7517|nr:CopD family protein [Alkalihalobacillus pseudalcaliphilus]KMK77738.1 hypothetical protein AB990_04600 [Alkalihalobacillus pseudalcaliphilus]
MLVVSNLFTYIFIILLTGILLISLKPDRDKDIRGKRFLKWGSIVGLILTTGVSVYQLCHMLYTQFSLPLSEAIFQVLTKFQAGHAWLAIVFCLFVMMIIEGTSQKRSHRFTEYSQLFLLIGIMFFISLTSHSGASEGLLGSLVHLLHMLAFSFWLGPLFVMAWLTKPKESIHDFHRWFSPLAMFTFSMLVISGILLMNFLIPNYMNSWAIDYGQAMLWKHLLFIPVIVFGFRHLYLLKKYPQWLSKIEYQRSFRVESLYAFLVLAISSWMTEREPPLEISMSEGYNSLFLLFHNQAVDGVLQSSWTFTSVTFIIGSLVIFLSTGYYLLKRKLLSIAVIMLLLAHICLYIGLMLIRIIILG